MFKSLKEKKFSIAIQELENEAEILTRKFDAINGWIENNRDSDPNLYEMMECICNFGDLCGIYNSYYEDYDAYPIVEKDAESLVNYAKITDNTGTNKFKATHYAVPYLNPNLKSAKESLDKMINYRRDHELFNDQVAENLFFNTYKAAVSAEFLPEKEDSKKLRTNILAKCGGIYNFIHQEQLKNPKYQYDNKTEFEKLLKDIRTYEFSSKYSQFTEIMEETVNAINENYLYRENKTNNNTK